MGARCAREGGRERTAVSFQPTNESINSTSLPWTSPADDGGGGDGVVAIGVTTRGGGVAGRERRGIRVRQGGCSLGVMAKRLAGELAGHQGRLPLRQVLRREP